MSAADHPKQACTGQAEAVRREVNEARREFEAAASQYKETMARLQQSAFRSNQPVLERERPVVREQVGLAAVAVTERATGVLMARHGCGAGEAASILRQEAERAGVSVAEMADRIAARVIGRSPVYRTHRAHHGSRPSAWPVAVDPWPVAVDPRPVENDETDVPIG